MLTQPKIKIRLEHHSLVYTAGNIVMLATGITASDKRALVLIATSLMSVLVYRYASPGKGVRIWEPYPVNESLNCQNETLALFGGEGWPREG